MPYLDIPITITNDLEQRIADAFLLYDFDGSKMIQSTKVSTVLRFLGCVPSEEEIKEFIATSEFEDIPGYVHLTRFISSLNECLLSDKMRPATEEELAIAFKLLDPRSNGYIKSDEFIGKIIEHGEPLSDKELASMKSVAVGDSLCIYEPYMCKILFKPEDSIYELAKDIEMARKTSEPEPKKSIFQYIEGL